MSKVEHPPHYGGEDNPFEVIKVLGQWLTPAEFVGFCKGNMMKYTARANSKAGLEDHDKAAWYAKRLTSFIRDQRAAGEPDGLPVAPLYWADLDPVPCEDRDEVIACCEHGCVVMLCSTVEPHVTWFVTLGDDESGPETSFYRNKQEAERHLANRLEAGRLQRAEAVTEAVRLISIGRCAEAHVLAEDHGMTWRTDQSAFVEVAGIRVIIGSALPAPGSTPDVA